jgi:hypothetical protein
MACYLRRRSDQRRCLLPPVRVRLLLLGWLPLRTRALHLLCLKAVQRPCLSRSWPQQHQLHPADLQSTDNRPGGDFLEMTHACYKAVQAAGLYYQQQITASQINIELQT